MLGSSPRLSASSAHTSSMHVDACKTSPGEPSRLCTDSDSSCPLCDLFCHNQRSEFTSAP